MVEKEKKKGLMGALGTFGSSFVVVFCPVCIPAIGAFLSSIGLGFMAQEAVLKPVLIIFLMVAVAGLFWSYKKEHKKIGPLVLGALMAIAMYVGRYVYFNGTVNIILMYGSIPGMIAASFWNLRLRKLASCSSCPSEAKLNVR